MRTLPLCGGNIKDNEIASERGFSGWWEIKQRRAILAYLAGTPWPNHLLFL
jgi:hypothetical protein